MNKLSAESLRIRYWIKTVYCGERAWSHPLYSQQHHHGSIINPWVSSLFSFPNSTAQIFSHYSQYISSSFASYTAELIMSSAAKLHQGDATYTFYHLARHQDNWPPITNCDTGFPVVSFLCHTAFELHRKREVQTISKHESAQLYWLHLLKFQYNISKPSDLSLDGENCAFLVHTSWDYKRNH